MQPMINFFYLYLSVFKVFYLAKMMSAPKFKNHSTIHLQKNFVCSNKNTEVFTIR